MARDLYLSPHLDDVGWSLGRHAVDRPGGVLLGVFSRSACLNNADQAARLDLAGRMPGSRVAVVSAIRHAEDARFAALAGLDLVYCGLDEAPLRGRSPFDAGPAAVAEDVRDLGPAIMGRIRALTAYGPRATLFCPLGIGGHLDHRVVRDTVLAHRAELEAAYRLAFYEELGYASDPDRRRSGLADFFARLGPARIRRVTLPVADPEAKIALVGIYASQIARPPLPAAEFTPAVGAGAPMHEALWLVRGLPATLEGRRRQGYHPESLKEER